MKYCNQKQEEITNFVATNSYMTNHEIISEATDETDRESKVVTGSIVNQDDIDVDDSCCGEVNASFEESNR